MSSVGNRLTVSLILSDSREGNRRGRSTVESSKVVS